MSEIKFTPYLAEDLGDYKALTVMEVVNLSQVTQHPGFLVLVKMFNAACEAATRDVISLNPEDNGYQTRLVTRQNRARCQNEFSSRILKSIQWHIENAEARPVIDNTVTNKEDLPSQKGRFVGPNKGTK